MDNPLFNIQSVLLTTPARWMRLADQVPAELWARPPAPGAWSALQCLQHLLDVELAVFPVRVQAILGGQDLLDYDPETQGRAYTGISTGQLAAAFARYRAESLVHLERLGPEDLGRSVRHSALGLVTLGQLLHEWAAHDLMHTVQAEQALMQPFIAGCGPWRPYFAAHDVAAGH